MPEGADEKVTLLAGGGAVYVYPGLALPGTADRIAIQRMVIDVAYPADETVVLAVAAARLPEIRQACDTEGLQVIDCREGA